MNRHDPWLFLPITTILFPALLLALTPVAQDPQYFQNEVFRASLGYFVVVTLVYPYAVMRSLTNSQMTLSDGKKWAVAVGVLILGAIPLGQVVFSLAYGLFVYPSEAPAS
ncbi:hypothetical protein [Halorubrum distributum]|uniref:Uncharacterized protein n=1 Tax=Halorubrum distributum JCM 13916 TaxID=1230455 RepID=M0PS12_9EURY|nr:hypothetical protein [Halorubrum arcis]EMA72741.1 hypothetical protein C462_00192 [Halorubrum arcis JCM 13916]